MTSELWTILALLLAAYSISCLHAARKMKKIGRNGWKWFFISFFLTAVPAAIVLLRHEVSRIRQERTTHHDGSTVQDHPEPARQLTRCRHCGYIYDLPAGGGTSSEAISGSNTCPRCKLVDNREHLA
jgi:rubredoxin